MPTPPRHLIKSMTMNTSAFPPSFAPRLSRMAFALFAAACASPAAQAGNLYWDTNGATAGAGNAIGVWGTDAFWTTSAPGTLATTGYTAGSDVFFSAGTTTGPASLTINGTQLANSINFQQSTSLGISGGALQIGSGGITVNNTAGNVSLTSSIQLTANQTWANNDNSLLTIGAVTNAGNAGPFVLTINGAGTGGTTFSGTISDGATTGTTGLTINAANSTTTLGAASVANSYTGATTLTAGTIQLNNNNALGASTSAVTIDGNVTVQAAAARNLANTAYTVGSDFSVGGSGNTSRITLANGSLDVGAATRTITLFQGNATTTTTNSQLRLGTETINGTTGGVLRIVGGANATTAAPAILSFNDVTTFTGGTVGLTIGAKATTSFTLANGAFVGSPNITVEANGALNMSSGAGVSANLSIGSLSGAGTVNNSATAAGTATLTINGTASGSFSGNIQNGGYNGTTLGVVALTINKAAGTQILSGANTYTGATTVSAGTLLVNGSLAVGSSVSVGGGTLGGGGDGITTGVVGGATVLSAGAKLSPGIASGIASALTFSSSLNLSASSNDTGAYLFDLGAVDSSDKITLTTASANALNVGTLDAADFAFTTGAGFGNGTYTLFDANSTIAGSIGTSLVDFGGGVTGTLSIDNINHDILLTVVPEPSSCLLFAAGVVLVCRRSRRG